MLEININVLKRRKRNTRARLIGAQNFPERSYFCEIFKISRKPRENTQFDKFQKDQQKVKSWRHSTSVPCGNLVDGFPHDCHR